MKTKEDQKANNRLKYQRYQKRVILGKQVMDEDIKLNYLYEKLKQLDLEESYLY